MTVFQSILLGIVQGLTEFLPISSSAHLVLVPYILGWQIPEQVAFVFNVLVQVATLMGVIAYFWHDILVIIRAVFAGLMKRKPLESPDARLGWIIVIACLPAGVTGLILKDYVEAAFASPFATACFLLVTAVLLGIAEQSGKRNRKLEQVTWKEALWIGIFQAVAIFPGISRSGSTITGGMLRNLERPTAAKFSFLISIPIMLAAGLLASLDLQSIPDLTNYLPIFIPGFIASALTGYLSIRWLLRYLMKYSLIPFALYCCLVGLLVLIITQMK